MQAIDVLVSRRSATTLSDPAPDAGALELILASAVRAPDHGRLRPWRFVVIRGEARARFGELLAAHLARVQPTATAESLQRERDKAFRAPMIIVVAAQVNEAVKIPPIEQILSAGVAAGNVMLAALALGYNAMWKTGTAAYDREVGRALGLEASAVLVGFLYVGTDAGKPSAARGEWRDLVREWQGAAV